KETRNAAGESFDADLLRRTIDRMTASFTPAFFSDRRAWGEESELPGFIVGMPRSGTTLVEQIAASHPDVFGAGELPDVSRLAVTLSHGEDLATGRGWNAGEINAAARTHL